MSSPLTPTSARKLQIEQVKSRQAELDLVRNRIARFNEALDKALEGMERIIEAVAIVGEAQGDYWDSQVAMIDAEKASLEELVKELKSGGARIQPAPASVIVPGDGTKH
jgi:chromosome segregation ATPase